MPAINPPLELESLLPLLEPEPYLESEPELLGPEGVGDDTDEVDGTKDEVH